MIVTAAILALGNALKDATSREPGGAVRRGRGSAAVMGTDTDTEPGRDDSAPIVSQRFAASVT